MKEPTVKRKVSAVLKKHGAHYIMPVQHGMGTPSLDYHICWRGKYMAIETKTTGRKPTERQLLTIRQIVDARGMVMVIDSQAGIDALDTWLTKERLKWVEPKD
jgi:triacylglycerol esterase/lipase EstA (alpha/beta hydrolase family)